jgi:hypothetical protein
MTTWKILQGECIDRMRELPEASVDAVVCDPPYGLEFMGKTWDAPWKMVGTHDAGKRRPRNADGTVDYERAGGSNGFAGTKGSHSRGYFDNDPRAFQVWCEQWAREALRVLKPGGYMIAAGGSRTFHRLVAGVEDAGFEIRDCITWLYGSGFPKSLNVSDALRSLPACTCDVPGQFGTVDPVSPSSTVGAPVGTEPGAMPLAGFPADGAGGIGAKSSARPASTGTDVNGGVEQVGGDAAPVVLGSSPMTGVAAGDEVAPDVGSVEIDPEALRNEMVGNGRGAATVRADGSVEDAGADGGPADALVVPLPAAPGGVARTGEAPAVGDGHAVPSAVDGDALPVASEGGPALPADVVSHDLKCGRCGGVRRVLIPEGLGTALKPAAEFWTVARKPLSGTVASNCLAYGTGALNIDACRIGAVDGDYAHPGNENRTHTTTAYGYHEAEGRQAPPHDSGRWPANVVLGHVAPDENGEGGCVPTGTRRVKGGGRDNGERGTGGIWSGESNKPCGPQYGDADGLETVTAWECEPDCPVAQLDAQTGNRPGSHDQAPTVSGNAAFGGGQNNGNGFGDSGGASRFFAQFNHTEEPQRFRYVAKSSSAERSAGLDSKIRACRCHEATTGPSPQRATDELDGVGDTSSSTSGSGSKPTDRSLTATRSITSTGTSRTTTSRTSPSSPPPSTSGSTAPTTAASATDGSDAATSAASGSHPTLSTTTSAAKAGLSTDAAARATSHESSQPSSSATCADCGGVIGVDVLRNVHPLGDGEAHRAHAVAHSARHPTRRNGSGSVSRLRLDGGGGGPGARGVHRHRTRPRIPPHCGGAHQVVVGAPGWDAAREALGA